MFASKLIIIKNTNNNKKCNDHNEQGNHRHDMTSFEEKMRSHNASAHASCVIHIFTSIYITIHISK